MQVREKARMKPGSMEEDGSCYFSGYLKYKHGSDLKGGCQESVNDQFCSGDRGGAMRRDICRGTAWPGTQGRAGCPLASSVARYQSPDSRAMRAK